MAVELEGGEGQRRNLIPLLSNEQQNTTTTASQPPPKYGTEQLFHASTMQRQAEGLKHIIQAYYVHNVVFIILCNYCQSKALLGSPRIPRSFWL